MSSFPRVPLPNNPTCRARHLYEPEEPPMPSKAKNVAWIVVGGVAALTAVIVVADQVNQLNGKRWW